MINQDSPQECFSRRKFPVNHHIIWIYVLKTISSWRVSQPAGMQLLVKFCDLGRRHSTTKPGSDLCHGVRPRPGHIASIHVTAGQQAFDFVRSRTDFQDTATDLFCADGRPWICVDHDETRDAVDVFD